VYVVICLAIAFGASAQVKTAQSLSQSFTTLRADGTATTVDSDMAGVLDVDGVANGAFVTVTGGTAGLYKASVTLPALTAGQTIRLRATYVMDGIATSQTIMTAVADTSIASDIVTDIAALNNAPDLTTEVAAVDSAIAALNDAPDLTTEVAAIPTNDELASAVTAINTNTDTQTTLNLSDSDFAIWADGAGVALVAIANAVADVPTTVTDYLDANTMEFATTTNVTDAITAITDAITAAQGVVTDAINSATLTIGGYVTASQSVVAALVWTQLLSTLDDSENTIGHKLYNFLVYGKTGGTGT